jgi:hypothetical protein
MQSQDLNPSETQRFKELGNKLGGIGAHMRWIEPEFIGADDQALWIGRFQEQASTWLDHADSFLEEVQQRGKFQMLNDMEGGQEANGTILLPRQPRNNVVDLYLKIEVSRSFGLGCVIIDSEPGKAAFAEDLQPFAATATQVDNAKILCASVFKEIEMSKIWSQSK